MIYTQPIPAFDDNYIWVIHNQRHAVVVDPGDAAPVLKYLNQAGLQLDAILITHHHADHVGGNVELLAQFDAPIYGPALERIPMMTHPLREGDRVHLPLLGLQFNVLDIPGHTSGHIGYYGANSLFCGDTLFGCGCGRLFEGTATQMHASLSKLAALPDDTQVYCAHEYTLGNIRFAKAVDPNNPVLAQRETQDQQSRAQNHPTLPSTIAWEKATNPFLRCSEPAIIEAASNHAGRTLSDTTDIFAALRDWKNRFQ